MRKLISFVLISFALISCGKDEQDSASSTDAARNTQPKSIRVSPKEVTLVPSAQAQFVAAPASIPVTWSVQESGGGTITSAGLYTAPATAGIFHVLATSGSAVGQAIVTVTEPPPVVAITAPPSVTTNACVALQLTATVTGSTNTSVTWSLPDDPGCGTISTSGIFTSANIQSGTCLAKAISVADPTKSATTLITINQKILAIAVAPSTMSLTPGASGQFTANVTTTCGTFPSTTTVTAP